MGAASKQQAVTNFRNTVVGFKRVLGRSFKDPAVQRELGRFFRPNTVEEDQDGNVVFKVSISNPCPPGPSNLCCSSIQLQVLKHSGL